MKHEPAIMTKRGRPVVKAVPAESEKNRPFGFMAGEFKIVENITAPVVPLKSWKIMKIMILL